MRGGVKNLATSISQKGNFTVEDPEGALG